MLLEKGSRKKWSGAASSCSFAESHFCFEPEGDRKNISLAPCFPSHPTTLDMRRLCQPKHTNTHTRADANKTQTDTHKPPAGGLKVLEKITGDQERERRVFRMEPQPVNFFGALCGESLQRSRTAYCAGAPFPTGLRHHLPPALIEASPYSKLSTRYPSGLVVLLKVNT